MVLFCETFHCGYKGLDLPLQCGGLRRLVSLNVVSGSHRVSEYHATLVSEKRLVWLNSRFPQTAPIDDAVNLTSESHDFNRSNESPAQRERKKGPIREYRCSASQIPSEGQVRIILTTLEC